MSEFNFNLKKDWPTLISVSPESLSVERNLWQSANWADTIKYKIMAIRTKMKEDKKEGRRPTSTEDILTIKVLIKNLKKTCSDLEESLNLASKFKNIMLFFNEEEERDILWEYKKFINDVEKALVFFSEEDSTHIEKKLNLKEEKEYSQVNFWLIILIQKTSPIFEGIKNSSLDKKNVLIKESINSIKTLSKEIEKTLKEYKNITSKLFEENSPIVLTKEDEIDSSINLYSDFLKELSYVLNTFPE